MGNSCPAPRRSFSPPRAGLGLAYLTEEQVSDDLKSGRLVRALADWRPSFSGYHLYYPSRRQPTRAFTLLVEALRTAEVMNAIRRKVATRALGAGERLPSIRSFAGTMGVSPSTVVEAYDRLAAEGLIRSRPGSGFYVSGASAPLVLADAGLREDRDIDPFWVSRQSLDADTEVLKPGCGWLSPIGCRPTPSAEPSASSPARRMRF